MAEEKEPTTLVVIAIAIEGNSSCLRLDSLR